MRRYNGLKTDTCYVCINLLYAQYRRMDTDIEKENIRTYHDMVAY